ncbi:hypothetical protein D3C76_1697340 [compost metagenome]
MCSLIIVHVCFDFCAASEYLYLRISKTNKGQLPRSPLRHNLCISLSREDLEARSIPHFQDHFCITPLIVLILRSIALILPEMKMTPSSRKYTDLHMPRIIH